MCIHLSDAVIWGRASVLWNIHTSLSTKKYTGGQRETQKAQEIQEWNALLWQRVPAEVLWTGHTNLSGGKGTTWWREAFTSVNKWGLKELGGGGHHGGKEATFKSPWPRAHKGSWWITSGRQRRAPRGKTNTRARSPTVCCLLLSSSQPGKATLDRFPHCTPSQRGTKANLI